MSPSATTPRLDFTKFYNIINGELTQTRETRHSINPSTGKPNLPVPVSTISDLDAAVAAAKVAQKSWAKTTFTHRAELLNAFADELETYRSEFTTLLTTEQGKPGFLADDEFTRTIKTCRIVGTLRLDEELVYDEEGKTATVRYVPIGVTCALVPWNFPILLQMGKVIPALFAGNAIIVKPSPDTPYCGLKLVELASKFFPKGVVQGLSGGHELGPMFTEHPGIGKVSFTGSSATGKRVMASCAKTLKRVTLELGGNDAAIVCEDADLESTVAGIAPLLFLNSGQICMCIKRVYVHASIYDAFLRALVAYASNFKVGPDDPTAFLGPLQNATQLAQVQSYFDDIAKDGLKVALGGSNASLAGKGGYFANPTIIDNPPDSARIVHQEPFGPIVPVLKWDGSDEDILDRANADEAGLGASVWTKNVRRGERMARELQAGSAWVNMHFNLETIVPFGGWKSSGVGCEWGRKGLENWCNVQSLWLPKL